MNIIFFEDLRYIKFWLPLLRLKPFFNIPFFNHSLKNKNIAFFLKENEIQVKEDSLFLSCFFIPYEIPRIKENKILIKDNEKVGIFLKSGEYDLEKLLKEFEKDYDLKEIKGEFLNTPFKLIHKFEEVLNEYLNLIKKRYKKIGKGFYSNSKIKNNVEIDTEKGIVIIEENVKIEPFTFIKGPAFIGKESLIKSGAKIYSSYIGPVSRIGGEIDSSLFIGYSNKAHEGFIGHSIIGEWVNLGAMTTNSDLKNNYSEVKINIRNEIINTHIIKFGAIIGDHVKTGIGTLIPTGAYIDIFSNIFSGGKFCPKYIPPFSWVSHDKIEIYEIEKAIETAKKMMERRNVIMDEEYEKRIREIFKSEVENKNNFLI
ncbi:MAG: hypothetical protein ABIM29_07075 [candidate division WOR-3 bacterium]